MDGSLADLILRGKYLVAYWVAFIFVHSTSLSNYNLPYDKFFLLSFFKNFNLFFCITKVNA